MSLRSNIRRAIRQGMSLAVATGAAGCADTHDDRPKEGEDSSVPMEAGSRPPDSSASQEAGTAPDSGETDASDGARPDGLRPIPGELLVGCFGPDYDGGYWGQCCAQVVCRLPNNGSCPENDDGRFYGSGDCLCHNGVQGPFARPLDAPVDQEGECCYVTESIGCTGRPLRVAGRPRLAALVVRGDWCSVA